MSLASDIWNFILSQSDRLKIIWAPSGTDKWTIIRRVFGDLQHEGQSSGILILSPPLNKDKGIWKSFFLLKNSFQTFFVSKNNFNNFFCGKKLFQKNFTVKTSLFPVKKRMQKIKTLKSRDWQLSINFKIKQNEFHSRNKLI